MKTTERIKLCVSLTFNLIRVFGQLIYGAWRISKVPMPIVSIFGGSRLKKNDFYFGKAFELANRFVTSGISVLTGGGPGVMEAASCGAAKPGKRGMSVGISVRDLGEGRNPCAQEYFELDFFFARKWLLTRYSSAFIVFPGGFGTMDELSEVLTLIQTNKLKRVPIVLFGKEYWQPFIDWLHKEALKHGLIKQKDLDLFTFTDDLEVAFCVARDECVISNGGERV